MALNPLKVFLFVLGGTVAAAATAFYAGALRPEAPMSLAPNAISSSKSPVAPTPDDSGTPVTPADAPSAPGKQDKPEQQAATNTSKPSASPSPAASAEPGILKAAETAQAGTSSPAPPAPVGQPAKGAAASPDSAVQTPANVLTASGKQNKPEQQAATDAAKPPVVLSPAASAKPDVSKAAETAQAGASSPAPVDQPAQGAAVTPESAMQTQARAEINPVAGEGTAPDIAANPAPGIEGLSDEQAASAQNTASSEASKIAEPPSQQVALAPSAGAAAAGERQPATSEGDPASASGGQRLAPPNPAVSVASVGAPTFDLLRVEPDGSTVVAGQATPGATVEMMSGNTTLSATTAGSGGDFAIVLDEPLKAGDHQIQLKSTAPNGDSQTSTQTAVVSVPQDKDGQVLAMVDEPGEPSRVLTVPEAASTEAKSQDVAGPAKVGATKDAPPAASSAVEADGVGASGPTSPPIGADGGEQQAALASPKDGAAQGGGDAGAPAAPAPAAPVSVQAVEIEGRKIFVAGLAKPGATVRVYADDLLLGDAAASAGGQFLVEAMRDLPVGSYTVRVDMLNAWGAVLARAEVPFEREAGENIAAVAPGPGSVNSAEATPQAMEMASAAGSKEPSGLQPAAATAPDLGEAPASPSPDSAGGAVDAAGAGPSGTRPQQPAPGLPEGTVVASDSTAPSEELSPSTTPAAPSSDTAAPAGADASTTDLVPAKSAATSSATKDAAPGSAAGGASQADVPAKPAAGPASEPSVAHRAKTSADVALQVEPVAEAEEAEAGSPSASTNAERSDVPASNSAAPEPVPAGTAADGQALPPSDAEAMQSADAATRAEAAQTPPGAVSPSPAGSAGEVISGEAAVAGHVQDAQAIASAEVAPVAAPADAGDAVAVSTAPRLQSVDAAVIIRRGDSLWRISRRIYGFGTRYSTIYLANLDQIRNPDLIMPGQVFAVPTRSQQGETADLEALGDQQTVRTP